MTEKCSCQRHDSGETCGTCKYGICHGCSYPNDIQCRKHAPVVPVPQEYSGQNGRWPRVARSWWCGDYQHDGMERQ